ncbi:MAG: LamG domain-containing protein [Planctomycetota bacterium]
MSKKLIPVLVVFVAMCLLAPGQRAADASDPNLVVWYKLDESAGTNVDDSSSYNRDGTLYQWPEPPDAYFTPGWDSDGGHFGGSLIFYDDTRIEVPKSALSTVTNAITVSLWMKDAWRVGMNCVFDAGTSQNDDPPTPEVFRVMAFIGTAPDAEVLWRAGNNSNDTLRWDLDGGSVGDLDGWHNWTFVKDEVAGNIRIYFDGSLAESNDVVDPTLSTVLPTKLASVDPPFTFHIGARNKQFNDLEGTLDDFVVYDRALSDAEAERLYYTGGDLDKGIAWKPIPAHRAENLCDDVVLSWTEGDSALQHDVYFGTDATAVESATTASSQYRPPRLSLGTETYNAGAIETLNPGVTYYWRIDEINGLTTWPGQVWQFTINDGNAFDPEPADGRQAMSVETLLAWSPGCSAASHDVYFGADSEEVEDADTESSTFKGNQGLGETSFDPCDLNYLTDYYWRIDEVNGLTKSKGQVWSFQTENDISDPNFLLWYRLDESEGYEARDSSNYLRHGYVRVRDFLLDGSVPDWNPNLGQWGGSLGFDDDHAIWVPTTTLNKISDAVSIVVWIQDGSTTAFQANGGDSQLRVDFAQDISVTWQAGNDTNDVLTMAGTPSGWNHYVFLKDETEGNIQIYLNGELAASDDVVDNTLIGVRSKPFKIGSRTKDAADFRDGRMDEFMVYDRALTDKEVARQYQAGGPVGVLGLAWGSDPRHGEIDVYRDAILTWSPGDYTVEHDVYLGTSFEDVNDANTASAGIYRDRRDPCEYDPPGNLELNTTYYWRIDEVNDPCVWKGNIWTFTTGNFLVVDDFESYIKAPDNLWETWDNPLWSGSFVETGVAPSDPVNRGNQSMKYSYDITEYGWAFYAEVERNFDPPQDWTDADVKALTLYFYGDPDNDANSSEQMSIGLKDGDSNSFIDYDGDMNDIKIEEWQEWNIDLSDFTGVTMTDVRAMYIRLGDPYAVSAGGDGIVYFDDIRLYPPRCVPSVLKPLGDLNGNCIVDFLDVRILGEHWIRKDKYLSTSDPCVSPIAHWELDEGTASTASDSGPNLLHGTLQGSYNWATGHIGAGAVDFSGGKVLVPDAAVLRSMANVSAMAWIYSEQSQGAARIVVKGPDNREAYELEAQEDSDLDFVVREDGTQPSFVRHSVTAENLRLNEWIHVAGTYDGSDMKCYVNGQLEASDTVGSFTISQDTNDLAIGNRSDANDRPFHGKIDDVRVYAVALTEPEIAYITTQTTGYLPLLSIANLYDNESQGNQAINFRDYAVMMDSWLEEKLWPE